MYEALKHYIEKYTSTSLSEDDLEIIKKSVLPKKLKKRQFFLQEGEVCKYSAFIVKGAMRQYSVDEKGGEHIVHLAIENWWVGDRESFLMLTPSVYNIDAIEDCELLLITTADLIFLRNALPAFNTTLTMVDQRNVIATQKRLHASISQPADKRYADFIKDHADFFLRFPQHMIASFLGVSPETLSRIRKKFTDQQS